MNIKIKARGVHCQIGDDYDRLYALLKTQFGTGTEQLFSERTPGNDYLQWNLPGEGWKSLETSDPLMDKEVRSELLRRQELVRTKFGKNQAMAEKVLSVPDEKYIFYKTDEAGNLLIRLTAWGYIYPVRVGGSEMTGVTTPPQELSKVVIKTINNGKGVAGGTVKVNGFTKYADENGVIDLGELPVGYQFEAEAEGIKRHVTVGPDGNVVTFDITRYATVKVSVTKDGAAWPDAPVLLTYNGRTTELRTGSDGITTAELPLDPTAIPCMVSVEDKNKQKTLHEGDNLFTFDLETPKQEEDTPLPPAAESKPELQTQPEEEPVAPALPDPQTPEPPATVPPEQPTTPEPPVQADQPTQQDSGNAGQTPQTAPPATNEEEPGGQTATHANTPDDETTQTAPATADEEPQTEAPQADEETTQTEEVVTDAMVSPKRFSWLPTIFLLLLLLLLAAATYLFSGGILNIP